MTRISENFSVNSKKHNIDIPKAERSEHGIYFTPKNVRDRLFEKLKHLGIEPATRILEPSFGSGEFINDLRKIYPDKEIYGIEKHPVLFESVKIADPNVHLINSDFLEWTIDRPYDLIVGNPPYFVIKKPPNKAHVAASSTGRYNIYILFLYKCLHEDLNPNGVLAFVLPTSLYNCSYYEPMRKYIATHTDILFVENLDSANFYQTGQDTMLIIIRRRAPTALEDTFANLKVGDGADNAIAPYILKMNNKIYISPFYAKLRTLIKGSKMLKELGLSVKTGNIVWNQYKKNLTNDPTDTLLVYSSNIVK